MQPFRGIMNLIWFAILWVAIIYFTVGVGLLVLALWVMLVLVGANKRHDAALEKIDQTLMTGETLIVGSVQLRPFALWARRKSIGLTSSRILVVSRGLFGGYAMRDIQWKDLQDAEMIENVLPDSCGSSLSFAYRKKDLGSVAKHRDTVAGSAIPTVLVEGIPCDSARSIYSKAQAEEQAWEEKRRVRAIEETRAAAGGVYLNTGLETSSASRGAASDDLLSQLAKLKALLDDGVISDTEFQTMKSKLISQV